MALLEDHTSVFIVRIWREAASQGEALGPCKGRLEHVASGAQHSFATAAQLVAHLRGYVDCANWLDSSDVNELPPRASDPSSLPDQRGWRRWLRRLLGRNTAVRGDDRVTLP